MYRWSKFYFCFPEVNTLKGNWAFAERNPAAKVKYMYLVISFTNITPSQNSRK